MPCDNPAPSRPTEPVAMTLSPRRVLRLLVGAAAMITTAMIAGELSRNFSGDDDRVGVEVLRTLRRFFSPSGELTVVAWFTAVTLLAGGLALFAIAAATRSAGGRFVAHWRVLGAIFVFLSFDEAIAFHEELGEWVKDAIPTGGPFLWAWVIPYSALVLIVGMAYLPFLR